MTEKNNAVADLSKVSVVELDEDLIASAKRLEELKADRHVDDIPLNDEYFKAVKKHRIAFGKG